nr:MAG TPA: hypothetical protein [Caudoviricetes sp.]
MSFPLPISSNNTHFKMFPFSAIIFNISYHAK